VIRPFLLVIFVSAAVGSAFAADTAPKKPVADTPAKKPTYEPPPGKSMFARDRRPRRSGPMDFGPRFTYQPPPSLPMFVGAVDEEDSFVGFLLDPDSGQVTLIHVGDALPRAMGVVRAITLDHMDVGSASAAAVRQIELGQNLQGAAPLTAAPSAVATTAPANGLSATTAPAADAVIPPGGASGAAVLPDAGGTPATPAAVPAPTTNPADDLIERMRRRRLQELGQ
jgi:hypothetical protein